MRVRTRAQSGAKLAGRRRNEDNGGGNVMSGIGECRTREVGSADESGGARRGPQEGSKKAPAEGDIRCHRHPPR